MCKDMGSPMTDGPFFSSAYETYTKIDHMLGSKLKWISEDWSYSEHAFLNTVELN